MTRRFALRAGLSLCVVCGVPSASGAQLIDQPATAAAPAAPSPQATAAAEADRIISRCQIRDGVDTPADRLNCWDLARQAAPVDSRVVDGLLNAKRAVADAEKAALTKAQSSKSAKDSIEFFLARANTDLVNGSVDGADSYVTRVLVIDPQNAEALDLRMKVSAARKWQARKNLAVAVGAVVMAFSVAFGALYKRFKDKKDSGGSSGSSKVAASTAPSRIGLRIVDGLGRGRMYTIESDAFRIGAAESDKVEEKNDLVLSDADALVSRFHCALQKRKKRWTIVDSSVNGTWVNEQRLERGEPVPLRDGDEIIVAGVSRLTFIAL